jgi:glutathione peroxidase
MNRRILGLSLILTGVFLGMNSLSEGKPASSVHEFSVQTIDGKKVSLKDYSGKALLIVNTASRCGYTPQYKGLEALYRKYKGQGLVVLGFPSNDFGGQEPGTNAEIKTFCETKYQVSFPLFGKGPVSGGGIQPLFAYLTKDADPQSAGEVQWNFEKFVIDRKGRLVQRFRSATTPEDGKLAAAVEKALR